MQIKKSTLQNIGMGLVALLIVVVVIVSLVNKAPANEKVEGNSVMEGDSQIINVTAKGGYTPNVITAKANTDTTLRVITQNTFDCSAALSIPSLNISKWLPANGNTDIALGSLKPGSEINATCSMGMYSFKIKFI